MTANRNFRIFTRDLLVLGAIILLPIINYAHLLFSNESTYLIIFGYQLHHGFLSNQVFAWAFFGKLTPLLLLTIMYFTLKQRWKSILIPLIILYIYSLLWISGFYESIYDAILTFSGLLIIILITLGLHYVNRKFFKQYGSQMLSEFTREKIIYQSQFEMTRITKRIRSLRLKSTNQISKKEIADFLNIHFIIKGLLTKSSIENYKDNEQINKRLNLTLACLLTVSILIWFTHELIPEGIESLRLPFIEIESFGFRDVRVFIWFIKDKVVVILFLTVWILGIRYWWRYAILVPLAIYIFQFFDSFSDHLYLDSYTNVKIIPVIIVILTLLIFMARFVKRKSLILDLHDYLEYEINKMVLTYGRNSDLVKESVEKFRSLQDKLDISTDRKWNIKALTGFKKDLEGRLTS